MMCDKDRFILCRNIITHSLLPIFTFNLQNIEIKIYKFYTVYRSINYTISHSILHKLCCKFEWKLNVELVESTSFEMHNQEYFVQKVKE